MSKFWGKDQADVESPGADLSSADSDASVNKTVETKQQQQQQPRARWATMDDSSSEDDGKRIVRSAKEKQWDSMRQTIKIMTNHENIDDFGELQTAFESLLRGIQKARHVVETEGIPPFFIIALIELENYINNKFADKEALKKLSKSRNTNFNTLRSKFRKGVEEYRGLMEAYRLNPQDFKDADEPENSSSSKEASFSETSSSVEESSSDESEKPIVKKKPEKKQVDSQEDSDLSSSDDDDISWNSSDASSDDNVAPADADQIAEKGLKKWGKRIDEKPKVKVTKKKEKTKVPKPILHPDSSTVQTRTKIIVPVFSPGEKIDSEIITKKLKEVAALRGRKGFDRSEQIRQIHEISNAAKTVTPQAQLEAVVHLISAYLDANLGAFMAIPSKQWLQVFEQISVTLSLLKNHKECFIPMLATDDDTRSETEEDISAANCAGMSSVTIQRAHEAAEVLGTREAKAKLNTALVLTSFLERLDDELTKALQLTDIHSDEYQVRLGQSIDLLSLLWRGYIYSINNEQKECARAVSLRLLEQIYSKNDLIAQRIWDIVRKRLDADDAEFINSPNFTPEIVVKKLVEQNLEDSVEIETTVRAILYLAYNKSLRGNFYEARNLLQTTNIQDLASQCTISTQVLYNRNLVQLGLAAFSLGLTTEAHSALSEVCAAAMCRYKELLAQGLSSFPRGVEKSPEQERLEKRRLLPYHMHIAADLTEPVHNICAMLLEVPYMAANPFDYTKKPIARYFRRLLESYDRQIFVGPPENPREIVMAATKALQKGDWKTCCSYLMTLKIWDSFRNPEEVKQNITYRVQQEALRTYIFRYSTWYDGFSVHQLSEMFSLPPAITHSIVSKMMIQGSLSGSWDEGAECVSITRIERTPLQVLSLQLTEKIAQSVDQNETLLAYKNSKFIQSQANQRDDRMRRYEDKWTSNNRTEYWGTGGHRGGTNRWDSTGNRWESRWDIGGRDFGDSKPRYISGARQSVLVTDRSSGVRRHLRR